MKLSHRVLNITPPATLALSAKAKEMQAAGIDVLNLTIGEPDFNTPTHIRQATIKAIEAGQADSYTAATGILPLRQAVAEFTNHQHHTTFTAANVVVTTGGKFALYALSQALLEAGDEALIPVPGWVSYSEQVKLAGGQPVLVPPASGQLKVTPAELDAAWTPKSKVLILNSPTNPTGEVYTKAELQAIGDWAVAKDLLIIADDMYGALVYNGTPFTSLLDLSPAIQAHTILVSGLSKAYAMTGWRVGYVVAGEELIKPLAAFIGQATSNLTAASQYAALAALTGDQACVEEMRVTYEERLNTIQPLVEAIPGFHLESQPAGAFYLFPNVARAVAATGFATTDAFVAALLTEAHVALVPGSAFGMDGHVRLSYGTDLATLKEAIRRIHEFVVSHQ
mgnify:CR=1 FL=1